MSPENFLLGGVFCLRTILFDLRKEENTTLVVDTEKGSHAEELKVRLKIIFYISISLDSQFKFLPNR